MIMQDIVKLNILIVNRKITYVKCDSLFSNLGEEIVEVVY